jgi:hypothetical protein
MIASVDFLTVLVGVATVVATLAPIVLLVLWVRDAKKGQLW